MLRFQHHAQFFTATNLNWIKVLQNDHHKQILLEALKHRVDTQLLTIYGFVIMPNHFHAIWQIHDDIEREDFQRELLKFVSRSILNFMRMNDDSLINELNVKTTDRSYQVWERNSLSIDLYSESVFLQKLGYIHNNPVHPKWKLALVPEDYKYSSAKFYETGIDDFDLITHYKT